MPPEANSPAAQIGLEVGDVVFMMDDQRFRTPQDVLSHVNNTSVTLIDVRTGQVKQAVVVLPGAAPGPDPVGPIPPGAGDLFADNLGIHYEKVTYGDGTFGAKLTRAARGQHTGGSD